MAYVKNEFDMDTSVAPSDLMVQVPVTPKKRCRNRESETPNTPTPVKKGKATPGKGTPKKGTMRPIPSSFEEAGPEDRLLIQMKDKENKSWAEIKEAWASLTGLQVGGSTLAVRYTRLKANFFTWTAQDEANLLEAKKEVEEKIEQEKWHRIADAIETKNGSKFPAAAVQKKFKELSKRSNYPSAGIPKEESNDA
ncbi:conserved hypothetical protein [Paecilomyces variotii No. 5]|uniref:Myb-like domain-containing protein n=1 Tax=Byssochlamys spectabilis (strain No. 5 / NBRC 109023) TaxID=1356009 RepID=V5G0X9_BYSSN|nr:conserved hypothetical protein [Paecilomyces variotii No. 5]